MLLNLFGPVDGCRKEVWISSICISNMRDNKDCALSVGCLGMNNVVVKLHVYMMAAYNKTFQNMATSYRFSKPKQLSPIPPTNQSSPILSSNQSKSGSYDMVASKEIEIAPSALMNDEPEAASKVL